MALMNWNKYFETGIEIIDSQHLGLVKIINDSAPFLALAYQRNPQHADKLLDQLSAYAKYHFQTEGELIRHYQIDQRHTMHHFSAHKEFDDALASMRDLYQGGNSLTGGALLSFLANWLVFHILGEDQALARQIKAIEAGVSPAMAYETAEGGRNDPSSNAMSQALTDLYTLMTEQNRSLLEMNLELQEHRNHLETLVSIRTHALEQALQEAESANQAKSRFIANLSHEIRTPMNAIVGLTWLLYEQSSDKAQKDKLHQVQNATQQLLTVINDLLDMSSIESDRLQLEPLDVDLRQVFAHVLAAETERIEQKGLSLRFEALTPVPGLLRCDPVRISQIISNFLSNAIKFTLQGEITVTLALNRGADQTMEMHCAVRDQGIGMSPDVLAHIFQPFTQVDTSSRRRFGGTGLGLAICKRLVDMMGGRIGVDSTLGRGSHFWFEIPLTVAHPAVPVGSAVLPTTRTGSPLPYQADSEAAIDLERVSVILERLKHLLEEDDIQAITLWREMSTLLHPALGKLASRIEGELGHYNFEAASELTRQALATLNH